jgi:hypothetical protein
MTQTPIILGLPKLSESQQACVDLLRESLEQAESGNIHTIGIIVCMKTGYATVMAGTQAGDLNLGCDSLKNKILAAIEGGNVKRSSIVRAGK